MARKVTRRLRGTLSRIFAIEKDPLACYAVAQEESYREFQ